jgi:hypothetical protein
MILRPVRPVSPIGPPVTKRPVGLTSTKPGILESLVRAQRPLNDRAQHVLDDVLADPRLIVHVRVVLGRDQQALDGQRHEPAALLAVADGHLGLAVRPQVVDNSGLAHRRQPLGDAMRQVTGSGISVSVSRDA